MVEIIWAVTGSIAALCTLGTFLYMLIKLINDI